MNKRVNEYVINKVDIFYPPLSLCEISKIMEIKYRTINDELNKFGNYENLKEAKHRRK
jgi:Fic family protein